MTTSHEQGLRGSTDQHQLALAHSQNRVMLTHDSDYVQLHTSGMEHSGILYCHQRRRSVGELVRLMALVWETAEPADFRNQLKYL